MRKDELRVTFPLTIEWRRRNGDQAGKIARYQVFVEGKESVHQVFYNAEQKRADSAFSCRNTHDLHRYHILDKLYIFFPISFLVFTFLRKYARNLFRKPKLYYVHSLAA